MSEFAQVHREDTFSRDNIRQLVEGTISVTLSHVAQTFRANNRSDPRLDQDGKISYILQEQFRGYSNQDGAVKKQKALPMMVIRRMYELAVSHKEIAFSQLCIGAIFFAMRSCEYLVTTSKENDKRTNILRLRNFQFKKEDRIIPHGSPSMAVSDLVAITFEFQKNHKRNKTIHMFKTNDNLLCPVKAWAYTITRIITTVSGANQDTKVCTYADQGQHISYLDSVYTRAKIRGIVDIIGENTLGFTKEDVGLHSIRSGGAMAMFLSGVSTIIIQRVGRWESDAFMEYIREEVESFTTGVSTKMIQNELFSHIKKEDKTYSKPSYRF